MRQGPLRSLAPLELLGLCCGLRGLVGADAGAALNLLVFDKGGDSGGTSTHNVGPVLKLGGAGKGKDSDGAAGRNWHAASVVERLPPRPLLYVAIIRRGYRAIVFALLAGTGKLRARSRGCRRGRCGMSLSLSIGYAVRPPEFFAGCHVSSQSCPISDHASNQEFLI